MHLVVTLFSVLNNLGTLNAILDSLDHLRLQGTVLEPTLHPLDLLHSNIDGPLNQFDICSAVRTSLELFGHNHVLIFRGRNHFDTLRHSCHRLTLLGRLLGLQVSSHF